MDGIRERVRAREGEKERDRESDTDRERETESNRDRERHSIPYHLYSQSRSEDLNLRTRLFAIQSPFETSKTAQNPPAPWPTLELALPRHTEQNPV